MRIDEIAGGRASKLHREALEDLLDNGWLVRGSTATRANSRVDLSGSDPLEIAGSFIDVSGTRHNACYRFFWSDINQTPNESVASVARTTRFAFLVHAELARRGIAVTTSPGNYTCWFVGLGSRSRSCVGFASERDTLYAYVEGSGEGRGGTVFTDDPSDAADWLIGQQAQVT